MIGGGVNKICKPENLLDESLAKAHEIAGNRADAVVGMRKLINEGWQTTLAEGMTLEDKYSRPHNDAIDVSVMSDRLGQVKMSNR